MLFDVAITAGATFPLYMGTLVVLHRQYDKKFAKLFRLFLLSTLSTIPFLLVKFFGIDQSVIQVVFGPLIAIFILAVLEEFLKSLFLYFDREFRLSYAYPIAIGIGFAFMENVSYLSGLTMTGAFITVALIRLLVDSTAHAVFTSIVLHFIHKARRNMKTWYYVLGLLVSGSMHAFFNLLNHYDMNYLVIPFLAVIILWLHNDHLEMTLGESKVQRRPFAFFHFIFHLLPKPKG